MDLRSSRILGTGSQDLGSRISGSEGPVAEVRFDLNLTAFGQTYLVLRLMPRQGPGFIPYLVKHEAKAERAMYHHPGYTPAPTRLPALAGRCIRPTGSVLWALNDTA